MASLHIPQNNLHITDFDSVRQFLAARGVWHERWEAPAEFGPDASQPTILAAYAPVLQPFMAKHGYQVADVINVTPETPDLEALRAKFLKEHTHTEDEVRFFVEGGGEFWFNLGNGDPIFYVRCTRGDLLSVPAGTPHWFDFWEQKRVKAIRIFIDRAGWVPKYTESGAEALYGPMHNRG